MSQHDGVRGINFSFSSHRINFFDAIGLAQMNGFENRPWGMNLLGGTELMAVPADSLLPDIAACLERVRASSQLSRVVRLNVGRQFGVILFLEGVLTLEHLKNAQEDGSTYVDLPDVLIEEICLVVRVLGSEKHGLFLSDAAGNPL